MAHNRSGSVVSDGRRGMEAVKDNVQEAVEDGKEAATSVLGKVGEAASWVGNKADDGVSAVGSGMKAVGDAIKDKGPQSGILGTAASAVGSTIAGGGSYLEEKGISGIGKDVADLIRRHPVPAILIGLGLGFILARLTASSNRS